MTSLALASHRARVETGWVDYNGHLRDGYYALMVSDAADAALEELGLGADYRRATGCTLYTVEMHLHFLNELHAGDLVETSTVILESDRKRLLTGHRLTCARLAAPAAVAETLLLHVRQGETARACEFPAPLSECIASRTLPPAERALFGPRSRTIALRRS